MAEAPTGKLMIVILLVFAAIIGVVLIWVVRIQLIRKSVAIFKNFWQQHNQAADVPDQIVYFALGDSSAQGIGAGSPKQSYPYLVSKWLEKQTGRTVKLINLSVSGAKIADVIEKQMPELYHLPPPYVVTVAVGANNISNYRADDFENEMSSLLRALPRESYIANLPAFTGRAKKEDWKCLQANGLIGRILSDTNHHPVDLYAATKSNVGLRYFSADWFHPNARAYKKWAIVFEAAMAERIPELISPKR